MEEVARKFKDKAEFLFVYCREAHPAGDARANRTRTKTGEQIKQAASLAEREETAKTFCADMKMTRRILVDEFGDNNAQRRYGGLNNPTVVIDIDGKIALKMAWTNGDSLGKYLPKFLAGGAKTDVALADTVMVRGPGGNAARPGPEMMTRMADRILEGIELTEKERKEVQNVLQTKMEMRGRLRQQAVSLEDLARTQKASDAELAKGVSEFEKAVGEYQRAAADLDRKLSAQISARARAQLLAAGVLENGMGFVGMRGGLEGRPPFGPANPESPRPPVDRQ